MFLATTALSEFWDTEQELLFLGTWCLRFSRRTEWERLTYRVLQSPWDDRQRFYRAAAYVEECADRLLLQLADHLNAAHGVRHSHKYWRILLGPWLLHFLGALYDRVVHLEEAFRQFPRLDTRVLAPDCFATPVDTYALVMSVCGEAYNLQLYSQIFSEQGYTFPAQRLQQAAEGDSSRAGFHQIAVDSVRAVSNAAASLVTMVTNRPFAALCDVRANIGHLWLLALKSGFKVLPFYPASDLRPTVSLPLMSAERAALSTFRATDSFEQLTIRLLPQNFPTIYLEGFAAASEMALKLTPRPPSVIATSSGWLFTESFKFFAAERSEEAMRLVTIQNGGGYGAIRHSAVEGHERRLSDFFMAWGWARDANDVAVQDLPDPQLSTAANGRGRDDRPADTILVPTTSHPRYLFRFHTGPVGSQFPEYFDWQVRFLKSLPPEIRAKIRLRTYPTDYGHDARQRLSEQVSDLVWDSGGEILSRLKESRLVVIDQLGTTVLEAFALNVPTVLFWNPTIWEVRAEAAPLFERLRRVGILWDSPESAAQALINIQGDVRRWWSSEAVQAARLAFATSQAFTDRYWQSAWLKFFSRELDRPPRADVYARWAKPSSDPVNHG